MIARYQIDLYSPAGVRLPSIKRFERLSVALREREPGVVELDLPGDFNIDLLAIDSQLEIWRAYGASPLQLIGDTSFFVRKIEFGENEQGLRVVHVMGYSALHLLKRRWIPYNEGTSYAEKQGPGDDVMKAIVRENLGSLALDGARSLEPYLSVAADTSEAPQLTKKCDKANVLDILQEMAADARQRGTYLTFDVVRTAPGRYEFRTYVGQRGNDHSRSSASPIVVSKATKTLRRPWDSFDHSEEVNFVYATGQGVGSVTAVATASDPALIGLSPFNRCEYIHSASSTEDADELYAEASMALEENKPRRIFTGQIQENDSLRFGVHYSFGDLVTAEYRDVMYNCHVDYVQIEVNSDGLETIEADLRSETNV